MTYNKLRLFLDVSFISGNFIVIIIGLLFNIKNRNKNELFEFHDGSVKNPEHEIPLVNCSINN